MEIVIFVTIVIVLAVGISWLFLRPPKAKSRRSPSQQKQDLTDRLSTPADYLLASRDHMLHRRRNMPPEDIIATNRFAPRSQTQGQPEYDGYSRRDRSHVIVGTAHIKKEDSVQKPVATAPKAKTGQAGGK
jgi:hypothetical protein